MIAGPSEFMMIKKESLCDMKLIPSSKPINWSKIEMQPIALDSPPMSFDNGIFDRFTSFNRPAKLEAINFDAENESTPTEACDTEMSKDVTGKTTTGPIEPVSIQENSKNNEIN